MPTLQSLYKSIRSVTWILIAAVVVLAAIVFSTGKPKPLPSTRQEAFDPEVLAVQEAYIPHAFPADLPLEKNEPGFKLTQSTATLDYLGGLSSYLVAYQTPWTKNDAVSAYEAYLRRNGFSHNFHKNAFEEAGIVSLSGRKGDAELSVTVTERSVAVPEDMPADLAADFLEGSQLPIQVALSYVER